MRFNARKRSSAGFKSSARSTSTNKLLPPLNYTPKYHSYKTKRKDAEEIIGKLRIQYPTLFFYIVPDKRIKDGKAESIYKVYYRPKLKQRSSYR